MSIPNYKLISELSRRLVRTREGLSAAVQFLGRSLMPTWSSAELVFANVSLDPGPNLNVIDTIVTFSSGDMATDSEIVQGMIDANKAARIILVCSPSSGLPTLERFRAVQRFLLLTELRHPKETALVLIELSQSIDFSAENLRKMWLRVIQGMGYISFPKLNDAERTMVLTAAQADDIVSHQVAPDWKADELKSAWPVLRDISSSRSIILHGIIFGVRYIFHKATIREAVADELRAVSGLVAAIATTEAH